jgi:hypothetical protein
MTSNRQTSGAKAKADQPARPAEDAKVQAVQESTLEAAPKDQSGPRGESFLNPAIVGSGTIMADGTYGAPLPDPNVERVQKLSTEAEEPEPVEPNVLTRTPDKSSR